MSTTFGTTRNGKLVLTNNGLSSVVSDHEVIALSQFVLVAISLNTNNTNSAIFISAPCPAGL
jgi:hypothetical protein